MAVWAEIFWTDLLLQCMTNQSKSEATVERKINYMYLSDQMINDIENVSLLPVHHFPTLLFYLVWFHYNIFFSFSDCILCCFQKSGLYFRFDHMCFTWLWETCDVWKTCEKLLFKQSIIKQNKHSPFFSLIILRCWQSFL